MFWLLWIILVGLIAGWAAGKIMKGSGYGVPTDIALGIVGAIVGGFLVRTAGFRANGRIDLQYHHRHHRSHRADRDCAQDQENLTLL